MKNQTIKPWKLLPDNVRGDRAIGVLAVDSSSSSKPFLALIGTSTDGSSDHTAGYGMWMTHNAGGNRQMVFGATDAFGSGSWGCFRFADFVPGGAPFYIPNIDGVTGDGSSRSLVGFGSSDHGVVISNRNFTTATVPTTTLYVLQQDTMIGLGVWAAASSPGDLAVFANSSGTKQSSVDSLGNIQTDVAGVGYKCKEGANACMGRAVLVGGTVVVATTKVTAASEIFLTSQIDGGVPAFVRVTARTAGTNFTITSGNALDTSTIAWLIMEPS